MLSAQGSPVRPKPLASSQLTQRLREAAEIDTHLVQLEQARNELLLQQQLRGPAPPPPPRPPPNDLEEEESLPPLSPVLQEDEEEGDESSALRRVLELAPQYFEDETTLGYIRDLVQQAQVSLPTTISDQIHTLVLTKKRKPQSISSSGRFWEAIITSATIRHGRVEYEIRSQLTSGNTTGTSVVRRRYRDFDRLHRAMRAQVADYVLIPSLPPKDSLRITKSRTDPDFVWNRRVGLQFWLRFVFEHQVLRNSSLLREFLWEPSSCAVSSTDKKRFDDHNLTAEAKLWGLALGRQRANMKSRFGNETVALTSMRLRIDSSIESLQQASIKCLGVIKQDEQMSKLLHLAQKTFTDFAKLEIGSGQNFAFMQQFAACLPALDVNRPVAEDSFLVSFKTNEHFVEAPVALGATCDVRSLKALGTLIHLWGTDILPRLERHRVNPTESNTVKGHRVACEWVEMESLKLGMCKDSLHRFVCDQIKHSQEERERWQSVVESIQDQQVELSSFFVALGDVQVPTGVVVSKPASQQQQQHYHHPARTGSSTSDSEEETYADALSTPDTSSSPKPPVHHQQQLDSNLDDVQARFVKQQLEEPSALFEGGFKNPFDDDDG
ncbi:hypothetical protein BASA81_000481 [Batrachochytrium salamandrivorans]|nr:hypothetical protein BASA81_000481 [Batrachochytrium salamandrivorans]